MPAPRDLPEPPPSPPAGAIMTAVCNGLLVIALGLAETEGATYKAKEGKAADVEIAQTSAA